jgi:hypothetical protein
LRQKTEKGNVAVNIDVPSSISVPRDGRNMADATGYKKNAKMEKKGIDPFASRMRNGRSTI